MKKIITIVAIIMILAIAATTLFACNRGNDFDSDKLNGSLDGSLETDIDKSESLASKDWMVLPDSDDQESLKILAENMYTNANRLMKNLSYRQQKVYADVTTDAKFGLLSISVKPKQYNYTVMNGDELIYIECQQDGDPLTASYMSITYSNATLNKSITWNGGNDCTCTVDDNGAYIYDADLSSGSMGEITEASLFAKEQEYVYYQTSFVINRNTVQNVVISHNDEGGYYTLDFDIDLSERSTYEEPVRGLEANVDDAKYESVHEHIEIWDSGYYKYFQSVDVWSGKKVVSLTATLDYRTYFSYYKKDCQIDDVFAIDEMRAKLN